jgi:hypothetical protein
MAAMMSARDRVLSSCLSALSADELSTLGALSEQLLRASPFDNGGVQSLCRLCGYSKCNLRSLENDGCGR